MSYPPSKPFRDFSDDEFYEYLKNRDHDNPWTLGELVEVERRGDDFFDRDPNLKKEYQATKERFLESMRGAVKPLTDNIREIGEKLAQDSTSKSLELIFKKWTKDYFDAFKINSPFFEALARRTMEAPWLVENKSNKEIIRKFGETLARNAEAVSQFDVTRVTGSVGSNQMGRPAIDPETIEVVKKPFERQIEEETESQFSVLLGQISENTKRTSERVRFGWQQWVILIASVIAAITGLISITRHP